MTDVKEMIEVMRAFAEGKKIEAKHRTLSHKWCGTDNPLWNWLECDYRVADEQDGVVYIVVGNSEGSRGLRNTLIYNAYHHGGSAAVFAKQSEALKFKDDMAESFPDTTYTLLTVEVIR